MDDTQLFTEIFGVDTEYEAVLVSGHDGEKWFGHLRFTNPLYSPSVTTNDYFGYSVSPKSSGEYFRGNAHYEWCVLRSIFENVRASKGGA